MKIQHFLLLSTCLLAFASGNAHAQKSFVVSGNPQAPPVVWEEQEKLVGLAPDLASAILQDLGLPYTLRRFGDWQNVQKKARSGEIDLLVSAYRNKEREEYLDFSIPYLSQPTVIIVEKGKEFDFKDWSSLQGKKGGSNIGESYGQDFDTYIKQSLTVEYFPFERAIQDLNLGEIDYLIVDLSTALIYSRLLQGEESISILEPPVTVQDFHLAVRADSPLAAHLPDINKKITEKIQSGFISDTLLHHFDRWQRLIDRRAGYIDATRQAQSAQQQDYLKEQDEAARQRILKTMVDREGRPDPTQ